MTARPSPLVALLAILALAVSFRSVTYARSNAGPSSQRTLAAKRDSMAGLFASAPSEIPASGWWAVLKRTATKFSENELMSEAASVTFFALLAIFPAIAALISLYGLFADPKLIADHLDMASGFLPGGGMDIIKEQVQRLTENPAGKLGFGAILGIATALWSANQGSKAIFSALNDVYQEKETRGFVKLTAITLAFTACALVFLLAALGAVVVMPIVLNVLGLSGWADTVLRFARWPGLLILIIGFLAALYRFGPSRSAVRWRWISWGSTFAAIAWVGLSIGFSWYVSEFGNYNKTYGSLGAVIGFMTWMWLSTTVILIGAQLNAELEAQTVRS